MCVICVYQLYLHKSKKLYIISFNSTKFVNAFCSLLKLDKLSPKLSSMTVIKNVLKRIQSYQYFSIIMSFLILTAVHILTPSGCSTIQLSSGTVYPEIMSDAIDLRLTFSRLPPNSDANYNSRCYLCFSPSGCKWITAPPLLTLTC